MRGIFFMGSDASPKFEVKEMELASLGGHEVLVRNKACGVCGTDSACGRRRYDWAFDGSDGKAVRRVHSNIE